MDRGLPGGLVLSFSAHGFLLGAFVVAAFLGPKEPLLKIQEGFVVAMPPGGGGSPAAVQPPPAAPEPVKPEAQPPQPEPRLKVIKPPKEEKRTGLPELDAKKSKKKPEKPREAPSAGAAATTGTSSQMPGLSFGEPGPGAPGGTDPNGDFYLAGVQRKIWMLWQQEVRAGTWQPVK